MVLHVRASGAGGEAALTRGRGSATPRSLRVHSGGRGSQAFGGSSRACVDVLVRGLP